MTELSRSEIEHITGRLDDGLVVEIQATGATGEELAEAFEWLYADDAMARDLHREPTGRVAVLCEILSRGAPGEEDEAPVSPGT